VDRVLETGDRS